MRDRQATGRLGEDLAAAHLERAGYRVLERNIRSRWGEIDIIAQDGSCIVFVEVRTVRSAKLMPEESIGRLKQRRIAALGYRYLQETGRTDADWRADVIAIELGDRDRVLRLQHLINAVEEP